MLRWIPARSPMQRIAAAVLCWPIALSVAWPAAFALVWSGPFSLAFFGAPLVLAFWAMSVAVALALAVGLVIERSWLRSLAMLALPLTALFAALNLGFVWRAGQRAGDYVHLCVMLPILCYASNLSK